MKELVCVCVYACVCLCVCVSVCLCVSRVLCSTVKELVSKLASTGRDDVDTVSISSKCSVLNQKLDALIKTLHEESHAASLHAVGLRCHVTRGGCGSCPVSKRLAKQTKRLVLCAVQLLSD